MQKTTNCYHAKIVLFDGFSNLCLANTIEPLRAANNVLGERSFTWDVLTITGDPVQSSSGMTIQPDGKLTTDIPGRRLFLISSYGYDKIFTKKLGEIMRRHVYDGGTMFGMDTGAWLMAEAGLLKGKSATIHWDVLSRFEEQFLSVHVENRPFVHDDKMRTCGGAMAAFDLMLYLIAQDFGAQVRFDVESLFKRPMSLRADVEGEALSGLALTRKAIALMRDNLEAPLKVTDLASKLAVHPKQLERAFNREFGMPSGQIYKRLRLNSVRDLVENTDANFSDIAVRSGYKSASAMSRAFTSEYGYTPSQLRKSVS